MSQKASELARQALTTFRPPEDLLLADWVVNNITLPEGKSVRPGPLENWPYLIDILNVMGDRGVERVTVMKSARLGYTAGIMFVLAATAAMDPGPIILLMPTDDDARGISVDSVEPIFRSNRVLQGLMRFGRLDGRNTLTRKSLSGGGSIKILSARAPRNLRRQDCRLLLCDEVDAYDVTSEGDALNLAERRTMAHANRKIVIGSTPHGQPAAPPYLVELAAIGCLDGKFSDRTMPGRPSRSFDNRLRHVEGYLARGGCWNSRRYTRACIDKALLEELRAWTT